MGKITAKQFWGAFSRQLLATCPTQEMWNDDYTWTEHSVAVAERVLQQLGLESDAAPAVLESGRFELGLKISREYFRVDLIAEERLESGCNWLLRVAFEHENGPRNCWDSRAL